MSEFLDHLSLTVIAGNGGSGMVSFRREKFVPKGGPDGGNGGRGGHIIFRASRNLNTLSHLTPNAHIRAGNGAAGGSKNKTGAAGKDEFVHVPLGTIVKSSGSQKIHAELLEEGQEVIIAKGGLGGKGNASFARSTRQTPRFSQPGEKGEQFQIKLELKLLADVGLLGLPNAGKSTLTSVISAARPAVADYPFTTLYPVLGVVNHGYESFVIADIPGLIEGAHQGVGLGHTFLRHIERTRILLHIVDLADDQESSPVEQISVLAEELRKYDEHLAGKPRIIVGNKTDLNPPAGHFNELTEYGRTHGYPVLYISAATGDGIDAMIKQIIASLAALPRQEKREKQEHDSEVH